MLIYVLLLVATGLVMGSIRTCSPSSLPMPRHGDSGGDTLDVAIIYGPLSYYMYADTLGGLNYDMIRIMARDMNRPVKFWPVVGINDGLTRLENGHYDMLASLPSSFNFKSRFSCSESVFLDKLVLVQKVPAGSSPKIASALDLADDSVYVAADSPAKLRLDNLSHEIGRPINIIEEKSLSDELLCVKVASGDIRLAVVNEKTARNLAKEYPDLNFSSPVSFTQFQIWLSQRADTIFSEKVDNWLRDFKETPDYKTLNSRYTD